MILVHQAIPDTSSHDPVFCATYRVPASQGGWCSYKCHFDKTVCAQTGHDCKAYDSAVTLRLIHAKDALS